jgi:hypothetical protein
MMTTRKKRANKILSCAVGYSCTFSTGTRIRLLIVN